MRNAAVLLSLFGILLLAVPANAQNEPRKVVVLEGTSPNPFGAQVVDAVKARIAATTRYVVGEPNDAEIEVSVICLDMVRLIKNATGGVCALSVHYWPNELMGLSTELGQDTFIANNEPSAVAEQFFEAMVNASTEKELAKKLGLLKSSIALYEAAKTKSK